MVNKYIDHTYLKPFALSEDIKRICSEAVKYDFAAVCVNPCHVRTAASCLEGTKIKVASVVGFPFGTHTTQAKLFETRQALEDGASEIDMVINVGKLLEDDSRYVTSEIKALADCCHERNALLKVIVETCYLDEAHIAMVCGCVEDAGADFIKTSTGYGTRGASKEDIVLFRKYLKKGTKIKAAGGIRTLSDVREYVRLGCDRVGTSGGVAIAEEEQKEGLA